MNKSNTEIKKKTFTIVLLCLLVMIVLVGRLINIMVFKSDYYQKKADDLHERERNIKAARGEILDRNGVVLAANKTVCTVSVIHSQITDKEKVIEVLTECLGIDRAEIVKR